MTYGAILSAVRNVTIAGVCRTDDIHAQIRFAAILDPIPAERPRSTLPKVVGAHLLQLHPGVTIYASLQGRVTR